MRWKDIKKLIKEELNESGNIKEAEVTADDIQLVLDEARRIEKSVIVENVNV